MELYDIPFPLFRVGFADHSSWDMVWLRIDWNGSGFEGFVTDNNLARIRVKKTLPAIPSDTINPPNALCSTGGFIS